MALCNIAVCYRNTKLRETYTETEGNRVSKRTPKVITATVLPSHAGIGKALYNIR